MFRGGIGPPEILLIVAVIVLLFGAKKLPDLARGSGRALRIFKSETKGLIDKDDENEDAGETSTARRTEDTTATAELPSSDTQRHSEDSR